jgi:hypothetical protein
MSFSAVLSGFSRIKRHMDQRKVQAPFSFVADSLDRTKKLFLDWTDIYIAYTQGYSRIVLTFANEALIRTLSLYGVVLERKFEEIYSAKIPPEVYILVSNMFEDLGNPAALFVLAEGASFEQTSMHQEVEKATINLSIPDSDNSSPNIQMLKTSIRQGDVGVLYYERGQYDNPLAWPLLLHEGIHLDYERQGLNRLEELFPAVSWIKEVIIDIDAMLYFGPAFAASSAVYLERFPHSQALSHPHFISRLYASLLYLTHLTEAQEKLPTSLESQIKETFQYVKAVWEKYKAKLTENQESIGRIYDELEGKLIKNISRKASIFPEFVDSVEQKRTASFTFPPEDYVEKAVMSIEDVKEYYKHGVPIAADPRILFNSFISRQFFEEGVIKIFITQSLRKWYLQTKWNLVRKEL